jgi:hypothetical protein
MLRKTTLVLLLLISLGIMLPFAASRAHGVRQSVAANHRVRRHHSRAWWRRYRARQRKKRAAALAHRNALLGLTQNIPVTSSTAASIVSGSIVKESAVAASLPSSPLPSLSNLPANPPVADNAKAPSSNHPAIMPGQMNVSVVALSRPNPAFLTSREESRMLAGVNVSDLRRIVIDKMVVTGGWVLNDFVREVNGARVFVVVAHTPRDARTPEKAWTFYFTESGGRIYGLTTDAPVQFADQMTDEAERFLGSLHPIAQANNR